MAEPRSLEELEERARFELDCVSYPARDWVPAIRRHGEPVHDVVIVGGGQNGLAIAFRLMRERVTNLRILERSEEGRVGPWITYARMHTLRSPKTVTGPEMGLPSLSVRAWYEAQFGADAWQSLHKIPRVDWQNYLDWLRRMAGLDVTHGADVTDIEPLEDGVIAVHATIGGKSERVLARNVVLATGIHGAGQWSVPEVIRSALPPDRYAHTADDIDFAALAGKRVLAIGGSASAFDNAAVALEEGAASVDVIVRRRKMPLLNPNRWMEYSGFLRHFGDLDDARKWRFMKKIFDMNQPPPQETFDRCAVFPQFDLHLGSPIERVAFENGAIRLSTPTATFEADFLIAGTGFAIDLTLRPEIARFADRIALWSDRYTPPPGEENAVMAGYPYLSDSFQFTEKEPGTAPFLANIYSYSFGAMPSLAGAAGISTLKFGVERVALGITRSLFLADAEHHYESLCRFDHIDLDMSAFEAARAARAAKVA